MAEHFNLVVPKSEAPDPLRFHEALVAGLSRIACKIGRGNLADKSRRTTKALDKLFSGASMDTTGKGLLDFLLADPSALDEVLGLYGFQIARKCADPAADFALLADTAALQAEYTQALRDGARNHRETISIADKARPVVAGFSGIIADADRLRGVA